ncbi:multidrug effflux MFS transporter [Erwinia mallotivora]|uniref:multidrug effflux MFS transporter n=1 Tax=Erwinia mallotivora TaxID=69222 RepID=UPI0021C0851B|nr:multidrug effflux MFS transporter [Erwinia mallotivora]
MKTGRFSYALMLGALTALGPLCTDFYLSSLPELTRQLNASTASGQLTLTAALAGLGVGQFVFGPLSDRIGRKIPLLVSLLLFCLASLWCAWTDDMAQLIAARFFQGVAGAGGAVLSRAIARDLYDGSALTRFFALLMTINGIAPVVAPVLGGLQLSITSWRGLFISLAVAGALLLLLAWRVLPETRSGPRNATASSGSGSVFGDRTFMLLCLLQGFMMAGLFAYIGASSYIFQQAWQLSALQYSCTFAVNGVGLVIFSLLLARLSVKWGESAVLSAALPLAVIFALSLLLTFLLQGPLWLIIAVLFFTVSINSGICTLASSVAMQRQGESSGTASAWMGMLMFAMGGVSAPLTGIGGTSGVSMSVVLLGGYLLALACYLAVRTAVATQVGASRQL